MPVVLLSVFLFLCSSQVWARFNHRDALQVDSEIRLGAEYNNDIVSYAPPAFRRKLWRQRELGYQANHGSLDGKRFYFYEKIKLGGQLPGGAGLRLRQERLQDLLVDNFTQDIHLLAPLPWDFSLGLLASSDSFKQWSDLGASLSWGRPTEAVYLDLNFWAVDPYYNTKHLFPGDRHEIKAYNYKLHIQFHGFMLGGEWDTPLWWIRGSEGYTYRHQLKTWWVNIERALSSSWDGIFEYRWETKDEVKTWDSGARKSLDRRIDRVKMTVFEPREYGGLPGWEVGFWWEWRRYEYAFRSWPETDFKNDRHEPSGRRLERAFWWGQSLPLLKSSLEGRWGGHFNYISPPRPELDNESPDGWEVKLQTGLDWRVVAEIYFIVNFTWDADRVYLNWGKNFRPWGGGNIQIFAIF